RRPGVLHGHPAPRGDQRRHPALEGPPAHDPRPTGSRLQRTPQGRLTMTTAQRATQRAPPLPPPTAPTGSTGSPTSGRPPTPTPKYQRRAGSSGCARPAEVGDFGVVG